MNSNIKSRFCCINCNYFTDVNSNLKKHLLSKKHISNMNKGNKISQYNCLNCSKSYESRQGLWHHKQKCNNNKSSSSSESIKTADLLIEIKELTSIITEMAKNQKPSVVNNNNINNNININVFLNDKCGNAFNLVEFIKNIDFANENYERLITDYVNGNAELIEKNYNQLPEFERPLYCFTNEDEHQQIAHIQCDNKWVLEPEIVWNKKIKNGENNTTEEDNKLIPNSMYSLIRMFDKKKLAYFNDKYKDSNIYRKCRKLESDSCNPDLQMKLIDKLITMSTINL